jgi:CheY-like chemotaxis protein
MGNTVIYCNRIVRTYLERAGYRVTEAADGRSAISAIALEMPLLVVLDVMLPEVDGIAVLKAVRRTDRTPVIILSARGLVDDRIAGLAAGADDYLPKPFSPAELVLRVQRILERAGTDPAATATDHEPISPRRPRPDSRTPRGPVRDRPVARTASSSGFAAARGRRPSPDSRPAARRGLRPGRVRDPGSDRRRPYRAAPGSLRRRRRSALRRDGARCRVPGGAGHRGRRRPAVIGRPGGIAVRIALAALVVAGIAIAILAAGVMIVGSRSFTDLMAEHGTDTASSQAMFEDAIGWVVLGTVAIGAVVAIVAVIPEPPGAAAARSAGAQSPAATAPDPAAGPEEFASPPIRSARWRPPSGKAGCGGSSSRTPPTSCERR